MGWRDRYQQASFRGVAFYVKRAESEFGRRTQLHEFPGRDLPYSEDIGRKARKYAVEGYVLGDDYYEAKEALLRAVEAPGLGKLVHPYYGVLYVSCTRCMVSDSAEELRMARFSMDFEEAGEPDEPSVVINTKAIADTAKKTSLTELTNAFLRVYSLARQPLSEVRKLLSTVDTGIALIGSARRAVANVSDFQRQILSLRERVETLVNEASALATGVIGVMTFGTFPYDDNNPLLSSSAKQQFDELTGFFAISPNSPSGAGSPVQKTDELFQYSAVIAAAGMIPEIPFDSYEAAYAALSVVTARIDALEESNAMGGDKDFLAALRDLRAVVVDNVENRADAFSRLSSITLPEFLPAIVLSNQLYGSRDGEADIVARNFVEHPGFIGALEPVKVKTNV